MSWGKIIIKGKRTLWVVFVGGRSKWEFGVIETNFQPRIVVETREVPFRFCLYLRQFKSEIIQILFTLNINLLFSSRAWETTKPILTKQVNREASLLKKFTKDNSNGKGWLS